ncbi:hypothetical protein PAPYR_10934 [Paratrimastix pyriformis]|uniref:Uncharacterized protein n=1 Tax=Paratrimastix pyriformis TaxID=342808 RepID=A0ABQ8U4W0_9EUKA|nr:hypothetical protein PAPYR_10934 [Paratrimastix pyriformis]
MRKELAQTKEALTQSHQGIRQELAQAREALAQNSKTFKQTRLELAQTKESLAQTRETLEQTRQQAALTEEGLEETRQELALAKEALAQATDALVKSQQDGVVRSGAPEEEKHIAGELTVSADQQTPTQSSEAFDALTGRVDALAAIVGSLEETRRKAAEDAEAAKRLKELAKSLGISFSPTKSANLPQISERLAILHASPAMVVILLRVASWIDLTGRGFVPPTQVVTLVSAPSLTAPEAPTNPPQRSPVVQVEWKVLVMQTTRVQTPAPVPIFPPRMRGRALC